MPIEKSIRDAVLAYCDRHIEPPTWFDSQVAFIDDSRLVGEMRLAFYSARHMEKLGAALAVTGDKRHPHLKFQILQFAAIYEAVISHLLFTRYAEHPETKKIRAERELVRIAELPKSIAEKSGATVMLAKWKSTLRDPIHVRFEQKLSAAVAIGFVSPSHKGELLALYKTRNAVHLESAARNSIVYEAKQATVAYTRLRPFFQHIQEHLRRETAREAAAARRRLKAEARPSDGTTS